MSCSRMRNIDFLEHLKAKVTFKLIVYIYCTCVKISANMHISHFSMTVRKKPLLTGSLLRLPTDKGKGSTLRIVFLANLVRPMGVSEKGLDPFSKGSVVPSFRD